MSKRDELSHLACTLPSRRFNTKMANFHSWTLQQLVELTGWAPEDLNPLATLISSLDTPNDEVNDTLNGILDATTPDAQKFIQEVAKRRVKGLPNTKSFPALKPSEFTINPHIKVVEKKEKPQKMRKNELFRPEPPAKASKPTKSAKSAVTAINHSRKPCGCLATQHSLITNCLNCGRIICDEEGVGPCFTCKNFVESRQQQIKWLQTRTNQVLTQQVDMGKKKTGPEHVPMKYSTKLAPNSNQHDIKSHFPDLMDAGPSKIQVTLDETLSKAQTQLDTLLQYDKTSAQRTRVYDAAQDFNQIVHDKWATPEQRAEALRRHQLRQQEYEESRRRINVSFEVINGRVVAVENKLKQERESEVISREAVAKQVAQSTSQPTNVSTGVFKSSPLIVTGASPRFIPIENVKKDKPRPHSWTAVEKKRAAQQAKTREHARPNIKGRVQDLNEAS